MSRPGNSDTATGTGSAARTVAVPAARTPDRGDPRPRAGSDGVGALPLAGQPGHGGTAFLRILQARGADGHDGSMYELICPECGDRAELDYSEVVPRLQWLRGPRPIAQGLAAYHKHLGIPWA
jgi:hypothetical protein